MRRAWGVPIASVRGGKSKVAHKFARWLHNPRRLGSPHRLRAGGTIRGGAQVGQAATLPLPPGESPPLQSWGNTQRWRTSGPCGYITATAPGVPTASERGAESEVAHKWAGWQHNPAAWAVPTASERGAEVEVAHKWDGWLHNPCRLGSAHRFRAGGRIRGGPQVGHVAA